MIGTLGALQMRRNIPGGGQGFMQGPWPRGFVQFSGSWGLPTADQTNANGALRDSPAAESRSVDPVTDYLGKLKSVVDIVQPFIGTANDAVTKAENLRAKLKSAVLLRASPSTLIKLQGELAAAERQAALQVQGEQASRQWRSLGQGSVVVGVILGVSVIALISAFTFKTIRGTR